MSRRPASARRPQWLAWAAIVVLYLAVRVPLLGVPLERDEGAFALVGQAILRGEVPYRDIFDHKPPGIYYIFALALRVVPHTAAGIRVFLLVWNFGSLVCVAALLRALAGPRAAMWAALVFVMTSTAPSVQGFCASSEMVLLLPLLASFAVVASCARRDGGRYAHLLLLLSGALGAVACWTKPPAVLPLAVVPAFIVVTWPRHRVLPDLAWWLGGALAVSGVVAGYFTAAAGLYEFWYWTVTHSRLYAQFPVTDWFERIRATAIFLRPDIAVPSVVGIVGVGIGIVMRRRHAWVGWVFLILCGAATFQSQFVYLHYFALLVPGLSVAAGLGMAWIEDWLAGINVTARRVVTALAVAAVCGVPVLARPWYWLWPDPARVFLSTIGPQGAEAAEPLARYIAERTRPDERIFIYGSEPAIPFLANRRDVNPFVMAYPLTWRWPRHREFQKRVWTELRRAPPIYLILARLPVSLDRAPRMDPFLEKHLQVLGQRAYAIETVVRSDSVGHVSFTAPTVAPAAQAEPQVVFEVWRRRALRQ